MSARQPVLSHGCCRGVGTGELCPGGAGSLLDSVPVVALCFPPPRSGFMELGESAPLDAEEGWDLPGAVGINVHCLCTYVPVYIKTLSFKMAYTL